MGETWLPVALGQFSSTAKREEAEKGEQGEGRGERSREEGRGEEGRGVERIESKAGEGDNMGEEKDNGQVIWPAQKGASWGGYPGNPTPPTSHTEGKRSAIQTGVAAIHPPMPSLGLCPVLSETRGHKHLCLLQEEVPHNLVISK